MIPIDQTRFGEGNGNCFNACLASIMELPIDHFPPYWKWGNEWLAEYNSFLRKHHGLQLLVLLPNVDLWQDGGGFLQSYHVISGTSSRGIAHSVVGLNGEMVHDPHPDRTGLEKANYWEFLIKTFK